MSLTNYILIIVSIILIGITVGYLIDRLFDLKNKPKCVGTILIHKNDEAIDGQVRFTKDLWDISEENEIILKIKILPGEPGEWENKK